MICNSGMYVLLKPGVLSQKVDLDKKDPRSIIILMATLLKKKVDIWSIFSATV